MIDDQSTGYIGNDLQSYFNTVPFLYAYLVFQILFSGGAKNDLVK